MLDWLDNHRGSLRGSMTKLVCSISAASGRSLKKTVDRSSPRCNIPYYEIRFSRDGIDSRLVVQYYRCRTELILLLAPSRVYFSLLCSSSGQRQANRHQPCHLPIWGEELGSSSLRLVVEGAGYEIMGHFHFRSVALTLRLDPILGMR